MIQILRICKFIALVVFLFVPHQDVHAQAQTTTIEISPADPGRIDDLIPDAPDIPLSIPQRDRAVVDIEDAPDGAEKIRFLLKDIRFEGGTVYDTPTIKTFYEDKIDKQISLADLYAIAAALTKTYRNDGYILTRVIVPPQEIDDGRPILRIIEGFIDKITVQGAENENLAYMTLIQHYAEIARRSPTLNQKDLERALFLINDLPGISARNILSASETTPGASDLLIIINRDPFEASVALNNFGSRYLGPFQYSASAAFNSALFGNNEKLTLSTIYALDGIAGDREMAYFSLGYMQPVWTKGTTIQISGGRTITRPGDSLTAFDVKGTSKFVSATLDHPFIRSRLENLNGYLSFDYRNVENSNNLAGDPARLDRIRALRIGGRYEVLDTLIGAAYNVLSFELSKGLDVLSASRAGLQTLSRPDGDPEFYKITAEIQRLQYLSDSFNLLTAIKGQTTENKLLSAEEFGAGGISYGRGYDASEITGEKGFASKLELQWNPSTLLNGFQSHQVYAFWDFGKVWDLDPTSNIDKQNSLSSAGWGVRADLNDKIDAGFLMAFPLTRSVETKGDRDVSVLFNINWNF